MKLPKLSARKLKILRWLGYVAAYVLAFALFAYVSFPYERLRSYVVANYNASQTGTEQSRLEIDSLTWSWRFPGIVAEGVRLVVDAPPAPEGEKQPPPQYLEAEEVFVSTSALGLLAGAREASFGASALGGEISGWASDSEAVRRFELELDGVNPGAIPQLATAIGLPLSGRLSGHVSLELPEGNVTRAEGTVDVAAEDLVLGDGKAKIQGMIELPELQMGAFKLKAQITGGRVKIEECTAQGRDVDLSLSGGLRLRPRLENSITDMELKFSFSEKYKTQSDLTKALFGQPDSKVPGLFDTATTANLSKQEDGSYAARLTGSLARLQPRPLGVRRSTKAEGSAARRRMSDPRRSARSKTPAAEADAEEEATEEALDEAQ
jgi:type II secretion system protein N